MVLADIQGGGRQTMLFILMVFLSGSNQRRITHMHTAQHWAHFSAKDCKSPEELIGIGSCKWLKGILGSIRQSHDKSQAMLSQATEWIRTIFGKV
jgi:hypothetical protein